ncbi:selenide, water dikinase SelD [Helicobacter sp. WB40]|uniref:selenide, water dikinase SelD n=1 Tax=Helicobacter sp. WB40 TaxID=3004130 RepID=UPI0022EBE46A|nr:selenide, water dikinase SelD [Helicobacter sp. WB40]MDA3966501.1 selenide, water dikinase SelD [Helicobacter sp. WB40]
MEDLRQISSKLQNTNNKNILVDFYGNEDAGIYAINDEVAIVQSADFITPVVDDPYIYGQIAAANSISDIYAMGGDAISAINLLMWDKCNIPQELIQGILEGGLSKIQEAGAALLGGHTIADSEQKYGLSVNGIINPKKIWRNNTAKIGDVIILTKPIGLGILTTALKANKLESNTIEKISKIMSELNLKAKNIAQNYKISACTDITGFGLLGHLLEMTTKNTSLEIYSNNIPLIEESIIFAKKGIIPGGSYANKEAIHNKCNFNLAQDSIFRELDILLFDAQTSGGLALAINENEANKLIQHLKDEGIECANVISKVVENKELKLNIL